MFKYVYVYTYCMEKQTQAQQARIARAAQIVRLGDQIHQTGDAAYKVNSQTNPNRHYDVIGTKSGWICSCPDSVYRGVHCKHSHAIRISRSMKEAVRGVVPETAAKRASLVRCKRCRSENVVRDGVRRHRWGPVQQYKCEDCGKTLTYGFGWMRATMWQIARVVDLFGNLSPEVAKSFGAGLKTVQNRAKGVLARWRYSLVR